MVGDSCYAQQARSPCQYAGPCEKVTAGGALMWWLQAKLSEGLHFDYMSYGEQRIKLYKDTLQEALKM